MYVYLKFGADPSDMKVISNITIDEDCRPVVNGQLIHDSGKKDESAATSSIDAICWFKSLPMQAVYIDCSTRDARWCPKSITIRDSTKMPTVQLRRSEASYQTGNSIANPQTVPVEPVADCMPFMPESTRPLFTEQPGMSNFNPIIDEMFERVERLCLKWETLMESRQINKEVARILHCYVFPAVMFLKEDIPVLQQCLRLIVVKHENMEKEIVAKKNNIDVTHKYLGRLKEVILNHEEMTSQSYLQACRSDFVDAFYVQVTKDIQNKNMNLDILQSKINDLKEDGKESKDVVKLDKMKAERDELYSSVQHLLTVREAIRNHLYRPFVPKKKSKKQKRKIDEKDASLHTNFHMAYQQLVADKDHLKQLCYRKLHLSSVREAIESTVRTLQREHQTAFGDFTEFSINSSSDGDLMKAWKSMQARVEGWMDRDSSLSQLHIKGCQLIKDLVEGMLSDSQISLMGLDSSQQGQTEKIPCGNGDGSYGDISSQRAPMVQVIIDQALAHMGDMAKRIVLRMKLDASPESRHINRAWMCYDYHFWKETGDAIEKVYSHYHAPGAHRMYQQVTSAALADIMDSHFFQKLFVEGVSTQGGQDGEASKESTAVGRFKSQDSISALSLDLQRCSVTDLYALANRDGAKVNCQMLDLEAVMPSRPGKPLSCSDSSGLCKGDQSSGEKEMTGQVRSRESDVSGESVVVISTAGSDEAAEQHSQNSFSSNPGSRVNSEDLCKTEEDLSDQCGADTDIRSSRTVTSVLGLFDTIVEPYHEKVHEVIKAPNVMEKMRAVWKSVDFLSRKTQEVCNDQGMDSLLPMSIFATASFSEDLFVQYFIQLLILLDFKPLFTLHSIYDFSLANAISTFMFLFEAKFMAKESGHSD